MKTLLNQFNSENIGRTICFVIGAMAITMFVINFITKGVHYGY